MVRLLTQNNDFYLRTFILIKYILFRSAISSNGTVSFRRPFSPSRLPRRLRDVWTRPSGQNYVNMDSLSVDYTPRCARPSRFRRCHTKRPTRHCSDTSARAYAGTMQHSHRCFDVPLVPDHPFTDENKAENENPQSWTGTPRGFYK